MTFIIILYLQTYTGVLFPEHSDTGYKGFLFLHDPTRNRTRNFCGSML